MGLIMKENIVILYNKLEEGKTLDDEIYRDVRMIGKTLGEGYHIEKVMVDKNISKLMPLLLDIAPVCVFNLCEEVDNNSWGEIYIAGILELLKIPYTGSGPFSLSLSLNKARAKDILRSHNIPIPEYQVFDTGKTVLKQGLTFPLIVKPLCEDGSFGIGAGSVVYDKDTLDKRVSNVIMEFNGPVIVEKYIKGREFNVAILGNRDKVRVLPISEIDYSNLASDLPKICSYSAKWEKESSEYKGTVPVCPADISSEIQKKLEQIAVDVYRIMECADYARVDIRLSKDNKIPYIIDVNPNPCISPDSGFVRQGKAAGMDYGELIKAIFSVCRERYHNGAKIQYSPAAA